MLEDLKNRPELLPILIGVKDQTEQMALHQLSSMLIKPVQRIMRYHLLLKVRAL
jgi:hypothetical protein